MASESEHSGGCYTAGEDETVFRSSASPEAPPTTATSASQNASNLHSQSDVSATNSASQQSETAVLETADSKVHDTDSCRASVDDLPDEMLIKIFSHMSFSELTDVVQKVCPRWRRLSRDSQLWADKVYHIMCWSDGGTRTVKVGNTDQQAMQTFCDAPNLRTVKLSRGAGWRVFRALYNNCHRLSTLHLDVDQKLSYPVVKNLVEKCPRIQELIISNEVLKSERFSEALSHLQHLRVLCLMLYYNKTAAVLRPLADGCPRLVKVDFGYTNVDMAELRYFLNAKKSTLKSVHIKFTMAEKKCVLPLLTICADSLERLYLYDYDVAPDEAREAFTTLGGLKNLLELRMYVGDLPPRGAVALAFETGGLLKLRLLDLGMGGTDDTVTAVSRGCPALRELHLRFSAISDAAFSHIHHLEHLEMLDVSGCKGLGGSAIPRLAGLPRLHTLIVENLKFPKLQPGLSSILELWNLRCLSLNYSVVTGVPFDKFPGHLVSLRKLKIQGCRGDPKATEGLAEQMPDLKIDGSIKQERPAFNTDSDESDVDDSEENAGPEDADEVPNDNLEGGDDSDGESSIPVLFLEDV